MQLSVALFLVVATTAVLVSSYPAGDQETAAQSGTNLVRDKRTIGILRDLFPNFSQIIDRKIQMLTRLIFRIVGRLVLQGNRGGGGGGDGGGDDSRVQITLPTYPPDELEDEDEDTTGSTTTGDDAETTTTSDAENTVGGDTKKREARSKREAEDKPAEEEEEEEEDLEPNATGDNDNEVNSDNDTEADESGDEDSRNKRFLNFNLGGTAGASTGGSGGGSGNFIFDIIRLVAGSGNTQSGDGASAAVEVSKDDAAYGVGVPGPLTRLFVVANKGVAALIQDLILRLAQTSERIVNFKARLITSII